MLLTIQVQHEYELFNVFYVELLSKSVIKAFRNHPRNTVHDDYFPVNWSHETFMEYIIIFMYRIYIFQKCMPYIWIMQVFSQILLPENSLSLNISFLCE